MTVFTFMCHHSIPSVIIPLADKTKTLKVVLADYVIVLLYCGTIVFAAVINKPASEISPLYSLNFSDHSITVLAKFLSLYPVFTLSSNFPLICITLRNNLMALFPVSKVCDWTKTYFRASHFCVCWLWQELDLIIKFPYELSYKLHNFY